MSCTIINYPQRFLTEFSVGDVRIRPFEINKNILELFVSASGDSHPLHTNQEFARTRGYPDVLVHGMCINARCSNFVAQEFVGSHGLLVSMSADFRVPVFCNEPLIWRAKVCRVEVAAEIIEIDWSVLRNNDISVQRGNACVWLGGRK